MKNKQYILLAAVIIGILGFIILQFSFVSNAVKPIISAFNCKAWNNFSDVYQLDCFLPLRKEQFVFKDHLTCQVFTNHQFILNKDNKPFREEIMVIKDSSYHFTLDVKKNELIHSLREGSFQRSEQYTIIKNTEDIIQAVRPVNKNNVDTAYQYEFITLSKNTGHGMEVWHNVPSKDPNESWRQDSIGSYFFRCY